MAGSKPDVRYKSSSDILRGTIHQSIYLFKQIEIFPFGMPSHDGMVAQGGLRSCDQFYPIMLYFCYMEIP